MPLPSQCISELFVAAATHISSTLCLRYAILGFAKPLRLNTNLCNTLAIQLISIHHLRYASPRYARRRQAMADRNGSSRFSAVPLLIGATLCRSVHRHCGSNRLCSNLRRSKSARILSSPCRCAAERIIALPHHCKSTHFRALPSPGLTIHRPAMPLPFFAPSRPALPLRCQASLNPRGAYFGVAHRPGPRNMELAYRLHHNQAWQLLRHGAENVDLVRLRVRVPDSVTDLDAISPSSNRCHGPVDVFIRQCHYSLHSLV